MLDMAHQEKERFGKRRPKDSRIDGAWPTAGFFTGCHEIPTAALKCSTSLASRAETPAKFNIRKTFAERSATIPVRREASDENARAPQKSPRLMAPALRLLIPETGSIPTSC
ncbi:hypothetical protein GCM10007884_30460 [Methylobacterium brachythecii]|uniref:Transposase n=1 Tax=Methylobacterium brachythecii TaxID=1176177 RepID=A0ABQ6D3Z7_9HYPH|nr:hypothetical protein GCM10007884_30460 [Methylobacterium brachythecii]